MKSKIMCAVAACAVAVAFTASPAFAARSGQLTIGEISFDSGNGVVYCKYSAGSSFGVGDSSESGEYWVTGNRAYDGPSHITGCRRNGVSVDGTGAGQWYLISAWQFIRPSDGVVVLTTFPAVDDYNLTANASSAYYGFTIRTLTAACAGAGGSCTFPVIVSTLAHP